MGEHRHDRIAVLPKFPHNKQGEGPCVLAACSITTYAAAHDKMGEDDGFIIYKLGDFRQNVAMDQEYQFPLLMGINYLGVNIVAN